MRATVLAVFLFVFGGGSAVGSGPGAAMRNTLGYFNAEKKGDGK